MPTELRVAHVLRKLDARAWGGTEAHVAAVSARLRAEGIGGEVHAPAGPAGDGPLDPSVRVRRFHTIVPFLASAERRRALVANAGNLVTLDEIARLAGDRSLDLAHLHTMGRIGGAVRTAMRLTGRPYVISVHGPLLAEPELLGADVRERLAGTIDLGRPLGALLGARRLLADAARVIVFNDAEHAALLPVVGRRVVRMDHGVDLARAEAASAERAQSRLSIPASAPVVLVVGRLSRQKNQCLAVHALARSGHPTAQLVLCGAETDPGYRALVEAEAVALGVRERVHLVGNLAPADVADLQARATVALTPSRHEAFGLVVAEAWAARRPVLFSRRAGLVDLARRVGGPDVAIEAADDAEAWGRALAAMLRSPARREASASAGRALVERELRWEVVTRRLAALYREVLTPRGGRA